MRPFERFDGRAVPLDMANVDTDQLIPKQFLKTVERDGLGGGLLFDFRFDPDGNEIADFVLNQPRYRGASILIAGDNFGCGSSREHAPWALMDYGFRALIAPGYADIFYNNCFSNGLLPIVLPEAQVRDLMGEAKGGNHIFEVDLAEQTVVSPSGRRFDFQIDPALKEKLLKGLDAIGETQQRLPEIDRFEQQHAARQPWLLERG